MTAVKKPKKVKWKVEIPAVQPGFHAVKATFLKLKINSMNKDLICNEIAKFLHCFPTQVTITFVGSPPTLIFDYNVTSSEKYRIKAYDPNSFMEEKKFKENIIHYISSHLVSIVRTNGHTFNERKDNPIFHPENFEVEQEIDELIGRFRDAYKLLIDQPDFMNQYNERVKRKKLGINKQKLGQKKKKLINLFKAALNEDVDEENMWDEETVISAWRQAVVEHTMER